MLKGIIPRKILIAIISSRSCRIKPMTIFLLRNIKEIVSIKWKE